MVLGHVCDNNFIAIFRFFCKADLQTAYYEKVKSIHKAGKVPVKIRINKLSLRPFTIWSHVTQEGNGGSKKPDVFFNKFLLFDRNLDFIPVIHMQILL